MDSGLIGIGIFLGILLAVIIAFLLISLKNHLLKKNALRKIKKQRLKFKVNGKSLDFGEKIEKEQEKNNKKRELIKEKKSKKVRGKNDTCTNKKKEKKNRI